MLVHRDHDFFWWAALMIYANQSPYFILGSFGFVKFFEVPLTALVATITPWTLDSRDSYSHSYLQFGLSLQQIMDVDEKDQIMMTNVWLNLVRRRYCTVKIKINSFSDIKYQSLQENVEKESVSTVQVFTIFSKWLQNLFFVHLDLPRIIVCIF